MNSKFFPALILVSLSLAAATPGNDAREQAARIIAQIQRADYEGDRPAMQRGYEELKTVRGGPKTRVAHSILARLCAMETCDQRLQ